MATKKTTTKEAETKVVKEVKEEVKVAVEAPKAEVKEEVTATVEAPKAEEKEVKAAKKAPAKKAATTKKAPAKKATKSETVVVVEYAENQVSVSAVEEKVKAQYVADGNKASSIKTLNIYVKPEDGKAYYVINETETGNVDLF